MQYKTIVLELLQQYPKIYNHLRIERALMMTLVRYSEDLKTSHEAWKGRLSRAKSGSDPGQIASEALEIALKDLEDFLASWSPPDQS